MNEVTAKPSVYDVVGSHTRECNLSKHMMTHITYGIGYWIIAGSIKKLAYRFASVLAAIVTVLGFFVLPMLFKASLASFTY